MKNISDYEISPYRKNQRRWRCDLAWAAAIRTVGIVPAVVIAAILIYIVGKTLIKMIAFTLIGWVIFMQYLLG